MLIALFGFVGIQLAVGLWAARRIRTEDDFLVAGRRLGPVLAAGSIFATWFGAESCIGAAGTAYSGGVSVHSTEPFAYGLCLVLMGALFAARLWRMRITTMPDYLALRFGASTERLAALLLLPSSLLWAAAQVRAFSHILVANADGALAFGAAVAIATAVAILYTASGGLLADVYTDLIQSAALIVGLGALAVAVLGNLPAAAADAAADQTAALITTASIAAAAGPGWLATVERWAIPICGSIVAQEVISRSLAARSPSVARNAAMVGGGLYIAIGIVPLTLGAFGPRFAPELAEPEGILPHLSLALLPAGLNLLFAGALVAAILSTVDSCLLVVASLVARNLSRRSPAPKPHSRLRLARATVVGGGLIAAGLACTSWNVHQLVEEASGFGSAGIFVLAVAGIFGRRGGALAANLALGAGLVTWVALRHLTPALTGVAWQHPYLTSLAAAATGFALGCAIDRRPPAPRPPITFPNR